MAIPIEASLDNRWPWQSNDVRSAEQTFAISARTSSAHATPDCRIANSSPPRACDEIVSSDAVAHPQRHRLEELVADHMAERIVDPLELVDIDIEDRKLRARDLREHRLGMPLKERAVRKVGQRIVMGKMLDPSLEAGPLGDILHRRGPAAIARPLIDQPHRAPVGNRNHNIANFVGFRIEKPLAISIDIAGKGAELLAVPDQVTQMAPRLDHVGREAKHVDIAPVADH
jgi:hypothetical protein